ncbi:MAG: tRNA uridine-5-carboxymethylaminomethyl(34) synthesis enzyme MnmG [Clostridiales bacterium]|nr:MAG: tRNA uridine-5-carboxymethylaminomethyl(34) synthesis enzyme MnmG [Clostridiales bacterium]
MKKVDVIVVGAGHAGVEAALSAARLGSETLLFSISLDALSFMPCNPSVGGTGKGHLVREIDALGGEMAINTDKATIQSKMLNTSKGPAVHSLRVQADKRKYHINMKKVVETQDRLQLKQAEITELIIEDGKYVGVKTNTGISYYSKSLVIATGTYLNSKLFIGSEVIDSGPSGFVNSKKFSDSLLEHNYKLRRFKTGTPARVNARSIDFDKFSLHLGDENPEAFSYMNTDFTIDQVPCFLGYTNEKTHKIINENIGLSAMFSGEIEGTGARYCPSIEDKINRFSDKPRHQLFLEPEGLDTDEIYVQGMSTSLPEKIQEDFLKSIEGFENVEIMRCGYAIEYDCIDPSQLKLSLESKVLENIFFAGQVNGSSGYEEAAAQGLIAGINAHRKINNLSPFVLRRDEAYIGVLIDDLVTKGIDEPFRMMTSRAEYRLVLRQDNADFRLTEKGREIGLVSDDRYHLFLEKKELKERELERIKNTRIKLDVINDFFRKRSIQELKQSPTLETLLKRSDLTYDILKEIDTTRPDIPKNIFDIVEVEVKYEGYILKQMRQIENFASLENKKIPKDINYHDIKGIRLEAREKLDLKRPENIGQASRIRGVNPADVSVLLVYIESKIRR